MSNLKPIILPLLTFNFTATPYSGQVTLGGAAGPFVWNMGGVGAIISRLGGTLDWQLSLIDDTTQQTGTVTYNFGANNGATCHFWNNVMVFPNSNLNKGMLWDYVYVVQAPGTTNWLSRGQQGLTIGIFPNDNIPICFDQGGLPCSTTMGQPLNYYDRIHGWTFYASSAGCPAGANFGATLVVPLSKFASLSSRKGSFPNGVNPYINKPEEAYFFNQQQSAPAGDGLLYTLDVNETNNIIRLYAIELNVTNAADCSFNKVEYTYVPLWTFDLRDTIYSNNTVQKGKIRGTNRKGTCIVMTAHDTHAYILVIQLPGPYIQPIEVSGAGGNINPLEPFLIDSGKIVIMNKGFSPPQFIRSTQTTVLGVDLRLPSYADPQYVNGTDTTTIL